MVLHTEEALPSAAIETFPCSGCGESVPTVNRLMHEVMCSRHARFRPDPPAERDEAQAIDLPPEPPAHHETSGAGAPTVPDAPTTSASETSAGDISEALAACEYCELEVFLSALDAHSTECGNRTDVCEQCVSHVRLKDFAPHRASGCRVGATASAAREDGMWETEPLLPQAVEGAPFQRERLRRREAENEIPSWAPVVVAGVGIAAAAAVALLTRRR